MSETPEQRRRRLRWLTLAEFVGIAAVLISGLGLWKSWHEDDKPKVVIKERSSIPLALRGRIEDKGETLVISPIEASHALDSVELTANGRTIDVGSDGRVSSDQVAALVGKPAKDQLGGSLSVAVKARYVEAGTDRSGGGRYRIAYRWTDGGLFGGRELRLTGFSRD